MYLGRNVFSITLVIPRYRRQQKLIHENTLKILVKSLENILLKQNKRHRLTKWTNVESTWSIPYKHKYHIGLKTVAECGSWAETSLTPSFPRSNINTLDTEEEWQKTTDANLLYKYQARANHNCPEKPASQFWTVSHFPYLCPSHIPTLSSPAYPLPPTSA